MSEKTKVRWKATYKWDLQSVHFCKEDSCFFFFFALLTCPLLPKKYQELYIENCPSLCTARMCLYFSIHAK